MRIFIKVYKNSSGVSAIAVPREPLVYRCTDSRAKRIDIDRSQYAAHARRYTRTLYAAWFSPESILRVRERSSEISIAAYRGEAVDSVVNIDAFGNR